MRILGISGSLRRESHNTNLLRAAAERAAARGGARGLRRPRDLPPYDADLDVEPANSGRGPPARGDRRRRRRPDRHARVQRLDPRRPQERAGLGFAAVPRQRAPRQAGCGDRRVDRPLRRRLGAGRDPQGPRRDRRRRDRRSSCRSARRIRPSATRAISSISTSALPSPSSSTSWRRAPARSRHRPPDFTGRGERSPLP